MSRPDWDTYFLTIARVVAARGDCTRARHGAVIVRDNRVIATGYNGTAPGSPLSCLAGDCPRAQSAVPHLTPDYSNCISSHAEHNAIAFARYEEMRGATLYLTGPPCDSCTKLICAAGIARIVHGCPQSVDDEIRSVAGDLWNHLENLRAHWQDTPQGVLIQGYIDRYEHLTGITTDGGR